MISADARLREEEDRGPRPRDGLYRSWRGRSDRLPARQSDFVVPVAECHAAPGRTGPAGGARPDRDGRLGEVAGQRARPLPVRGAPSLPRRPARGDRRHGERRLRHPRLGFGARFRLGQPAPGRGPRHCLHGGDRQSGAELGRVARGGARRVPGLPFAGRRGHGAGEERLRRAGAARVRDAEDDGRGDGGLPASLRGRGRVAPSDAHLAAPDPDRRRAGGRGGNRAVLRRLAGGVRRAEAVRQREARRHPDRRHARGLPRLARTRRK